MKFKCCKHIIGGITMDTVGFKYCNEVWYGPDYIRPNRLDNEIDLFIRNEKRRIQLINDMKKGFFPENCAKCPFLIEQDWNLNNKITDITISNWTHCNASCIYCYYNKHNLPSENVINSAKYNVLPIINSLLKENKIDENTHVQILGGEPTILKEFPFILQLLIQANSSIEVFSNGIKYEPYIGKMLKANPKNMVNISIDSGTKDTYKRIKRVDKFDEVVSTLKKYINDAQENAKGVKLKYIVLNNINDNKREIDKYFELCKKIGIQTVSRTIDHEELFSDKTTNRKIEKSVIDTYKYFEKKAIKNNLILHHELWADETIKNKVYNCRKVSFWDKFKFWKTIFNSR